MRQMSMTNPARSETTGADVHRAQRAGERDRCRRASKSSEERPVNTRKLCSKPYVNRQTAFMSKSARGSSWSLGAPCKNATRALVLRVSYRSSSAQKVGSGSGGGTIATVSDWRRGARNGGRFGSSCGRSTSVSLLWFHATRRQAASDYVRLLDVGLRPAAFVTDTQQLELQLAIVPHRV